jgi:hypothetical protein
MSGIERKIKNSNLLMQVFGRWPSFHDAEVISIELFREASGVSLPNLRSKIHAFEMTSEIDSQGFYVLRNHVLVTFLFSGIDENLVNGFNQQNVLWELAIVDISSRQLEHLKFEVHFSSSFGVEVKFKCLGLEIETVECYAVGVNENLPRQSGTRPGEFKH